MVLQHPGQSFPRFNRLAPSYLVRDASRHRGDQYNAAPISKTRHLATSSLGREQNTRRVYVHDLERSSSVTLVRSNHHMALPMHLTE